MEPLSEAHAPSCPEGHVYSGQWRGLLLPGYLFLGCEMACWNHMRCDIPSVLFVGYSIARTVPFSKLVFEIWDPLPLD